MSYTLPATNTLKGGAILVGLGGSSSSAVMAVGTTVKSTTGKEFMFVRYDSSAVAAVSGRAVIFSTETGTISVLTDTSDGDAEGGAFAGVICSDQADSDDNTYLWIQTKGEVPDAYMDDTVAAGDLIYVGQAEFFRAIDDDFDSTGDVLFHAVAVAKEGGTSNGDIVLL